MIQRAVDELSPRHPLAGHSGVHSEGYAVITVLVPALDKAHENSTKPSVGHVIRIVGNIAVPFYTSTVEVHPVVLWRDVPRGLFLVCTKFLSILLTVNGERVGSRPGMLLVGCRGLVTSITNDGIKDTGERKP